MKVVYCTPLRNTRSELGSTKKFDVLKKLADLPARTRICAKLDRESGLRNRGNNSRLRFDCRNPGVCLIYGVVDPCETSLPIRDAATSQSWEGFLIEVHSIYASTCWLACSLPSPRHDSLVRANHLAGNDHPFDAVESNADGSADQCRRCMLHCYECTLCDGSWSSQQYRSRFFVLWAMCHLGSDSIGRDRHHDIDHFHPGDDLGEKRSSTTSHRSRYAGCGWTG